MRSLAAYLRSLNPELPRPVWILQSGGLVNAVGNGIVMPFLFIYLHNVRGFSLGLSGLVLAFLGTVGLATGPVAGAAVDRLGGRRALTVSLVFLSVSFGGMALIRDPWHAFAVAAIAGIGNAAFWPSQGALLAGLTEGAVRHTAYAMQRVAMNLGIGIGGLIGGLIATTSDPASFTVLFVLDAVTFLVFAAVLQFVPDPELPPQEGRPGTYRDVLRDRAFVGFVALNVVFVTAGIAQLMQGLPVFAKNEAGVDEDAIGLIFFANTVFIVLTQLSIAKLIEGRARMRMLALMCVLWAVSWLLVAVGGARLEATSAAVLFGVAVVVFAVGETLHGPIWGPLVADLAPARLRGRYMALSTGSWGIGLVIGPAAAGAILSWKPVALWPIAAAVILLAGGAALALERWIPPELRRTPVRTRAEAPTGAVAGGVAAATRR